jgi:hypothetical protein
MLDASPTFECVTSQEKNMSFPLPENDYCEQRATDESDTDGELIKTINYFSAFGHDKKYTRVCEFLIRPGLRQQPRNQRAEHETRLSRRHLL